MRFSGKQHVNLHNDLHNDLHLASFCEHLCLTTVKQLFTVEASKTIHYTRKHTMHKDFKDFDGELPTLAGFADDSYRHDVCPSMFNAARNLKLWVDYADPAKRECGGARYTLCQDDQELISSDLLTDIEAYLK
jgi:hypothetical protein